MNNDYWYFLIHGFIDKKTGAYSNFYASGESLGEACNLTLKNVDKVGLSNCELIEASKLDSFDEINLSSDTEKVVENLFIKSAIHTYKIKKSDTQFIPPTGIVKSTEDGKYDSDLIKEHFVAYNKDEKGIYSFIMTPDKKNIENIFFNSLKFIPSVDSLSFSIENEWENEEDKELWINNGFKNKKQILDFIKVNISDTIKNGYVSTIIYCSIGETNIEIDTHKQLKLTTKDLNIFDLFIKQIKDLGFKQTRDFYSFEFGFYHWHYLPFEGLDKTGFRNLLKKNKFKRLKD